MKKDNDGVALVRRVKKWSSVWIVPIITVLIGLWIIFYRISHQGPSIILIAQSAEGIEGGKTAIKSRSVDVGKVEVVTLTDDLQNVKIKARLNKGMEKLLHQDSTFWVVSPQIGREGITGLNTLLSGVYLEMQPGIQGNKRQVYTLLDSPPLASPDAKGLRIILESEQAGKLNPGDPVLFRGYRVGSVETRQFDIQQRLMRYQLFIPEPFDKMVTSHVRFWKESGIAVDMSAAGMRVEMGSLYTLLNGGVSFDVPDGWERGKPSQNHAVYRLFDDKNSIQDSLYTHHIDYLMFFKDSIRGLSVGAPVEFRGVRLGTVAQAPFPISGHEQILNKDYHIPVLVRIEPQRFSSLSGNHEIQKSIQEGKKQGLRASLKTGNFLSGAMYIDLDYYSHPATDTVSASTISGYDVILTQPNDLSQIQQKLVAVLDNINALPLQTLITQTTDTMKNIGRFSGSPSLNALPKTLQQTLDELKRGIKNFQPGSSLHSALLTDMQRLEQVLKELQPILKTLNTKSNALVFEAQSGEDPYPKGITP